MQRFTKSLKGSYRWALVFLFIFSGLTVFGVIAWEASAKAEGIASNKAKSGKSDGESGDRTITLGSDSRLPNYDIRTAKNGEGDQFLETARSRANRTASSAADIRDAFVRGEDALRARIPHVKFEYNEDIRIPEVITPEVWNSRVEFLSAPSTVRRPNILRNFVKQNNELIGVDDMQADSLKVTVDAANPDGNISYAYLEQRINDIPVFRGEIKAGFSRNGQMLRVINNLAPGLDYSLLATDFGDPSAAVRAAAGHIDHQLKIEEQNLNLSKSTELKAVFGNDDWATTAEKMYFPMEPGVAVAAWRVLIWEPVNAYYVIVDAQTGTMLWRKNITDHQTQSATYQVYNNTNAYLKSADSPAPLSPGPVDPTTGTQGTVGTRTNVTLIGNEGLLSFNNNGWITDGNNTTDGNALEAGVDRVLPNGVDAVQTGAPNRVFDSTWIPAPDPGAAPDPVADAQSQRGAVIQMFYVMNRYHDSLYQLGFTEPFFNFQANNFGRGGAELDRISAEGQDNTLDPPGCPALPCSNNANFGTPADGGRGRMQMYIWDGPAPDYDGTADAEVIIHEATHGTSNRLHGNASGLSTNMSGGMGEGWSDFYAEAMLAEPGDPINGIYTTGGYATFQLVPGFTSNYYYGIRRFPRAPLTFLGPNGKPHNPFTFRYVNSNCNTLIGTTSSNPPPNSAYPRGPVGSATCDQVHNLGEIWSSMLWEVRNRMVNRLGFTTGTTRVLQVVTDGMKLAPVGPTFLQERDAIITAATAISAADANDVREGFRVRGAGLSASIQNAGTGANNTAVTEAYDPLAATTTTVAGVPNPSKFGASVTVTATVTSAAVPVNLGSVTFIEGGTCAAPTTVLSGPTALNGSGQAAFSTSSLSVGPHTITACYAEFMGWAASSGSFVQTVNKADTTTALASSVNPSVWGQPVIFTATISVTPPGLGTPTGNVSFRDNGVNIGTCAAQAVAANVATCSISSLAVASHPITAVYNGDGNFNASPASNTVNQVVNKADTATTITTDTPDPSFYGAPVTVNYTVLAVPPGAGTATGNVVVTVSGGAETCTGTVASGSCVITLTAVGARTLTATYVGDMNFNGSNDTEPHVVIKANTTTTITADVPDPTVFGQNYTVTVAVAVVAPGAGVPTGNVTVSDGTNICVAILPATTCVMA
ncbi:MAG: M36 family metallopeptidase, partial [Pyrinomonadaceae bacterium]